MKTHAITLFSALMLALFSSLANTEDIDIFKAGAEQDPTPPNVLIFLDNTSNWSASNQGWDKSDVTAKCGTDTICLNYVTQIFGNNSSLTQGQVEVGALKLVLNELTCSVATGQTPLDLNVGLMLLKPSKGTYSNDAGTSTDSSGISGVIRAAVLPLTSSRCATLISDLDYMFSNITDPSIKADSSANYGGAMFEAFKYFGGYTGPDGIASGTAGSPVGHVSYGTLRFGTPQALEDNDAANIFTDPSTKQNYLTPLANHTQVCSAKNFLLLVGNTWPNGDDIELLEEDEHLDYSFTKANFAFANQSQPRLGDVWARFLANSDISNTSGQQPILTYTLNVYNDSPDADQTTLLKSMAKQGAGNYYEVGGNLADLVNAFRNFFISINAKNTTFMPVAVTQSSANPGTYLNQMYLGVFRADKVPRWFGNLKLYQLGLDTSGQNITLVDRNGNQAASTTTGFILNSSVSFWTQSSSFWTYRCDPLLTTGDPLLCGDPASSSDSPDGAVVEKGAAGQMLRSAFTSPADASNSTRKVYTCLGCNAGAALSTSPFNTTTISPSSTAYQSTFGAIAVYSNPITGNTGAAGEVTDIINWTRGVDNIKENDLSPNQARPSMPGDVLHGQPVAVNYNSAATGCSDKANLDKDVVVYYASNDGQLHALQGGLTGTTNAGKELWAFLPEEFFGRLKRLRDNYPMVLFTAPVPAASNNKPYTLDGSLSVYAPDTNGDCKPDKAWLFLTMRRGGRFIYALDVTDKNNPKFLWKKAHSDTNYGELGQTWSALSPFRLADGTVALIFGGGYDAAVEDRPYEPSTISYGAPPSTTKSMGRGVFIVDAQTGTVLKSFGPANGMNDSVPSDVTVVTNLLTGVAKYAYVGDTGGNVWRISIGADGVPSANDADWTVHKVASLGDPSDTSKSGAYARKFLYPPEANPIDGGYALMIGSGDREKPFETTVQNRFYRVNDYVTTNTTITCEGDQTTCDLFDATSATQSTVVPSTKKGWFMSLGAGEKVVGSAVSESGLTFFATNTPGNSANQCALALGESRLYSVRTDNGGPEVISGVAQSKFELLASGGFPPSPKLITVPVTKADGTTTNINAVVALPEVRVRTPYIAARRSIVFRYREGLD